MVGQAFQDDTLAPGISCPDLTTSVIERSDSESRISIALSSKSQNGSTTSLSTENDSKNLNGKKRPDLKLDLSDISFTEPTPGQKCFGEKSDVERVLDNRCPCLQSKCLHLSGSLIFLVIICGLAVFFFRHYLKDCLEWLEHAEGWVSGLIFILMFSVVSFPMTWGYIVLNVAAGYLYGFLIGLLTVTVSVVVGVSISLLVCRKFIRNFVISKLQSEHLKAIIKVVESRRGFKVMLLTRFTPIPFGLQNGLFAITNVSISKCLLASFIGLLPTQALNSYMGSTLRTMEDVLHSNSAGGYALLAVQVGISGFLMWYVIRRARYELNKACLPSAVDYTELINNTDLLASRTPQPLTRVMSGKLSRYETLPTSDNEEEFYTNNDTDNRRSTRTEKKQGHKRAHSASAILYALQHRDQDDDFTLR